MVGQIATMLHGHAIKPCFAHVEDPLGCCAAAPLVAVTLVAAPLHAIQQSLSDLNKPAHAWKQEHSASCRTVRAETGFGCAAQAHQAPCRASGRRGNRDTGLVTHRPMHGGLSGAGHVLRDGESHLGRSLDVRATGAAPRLATQRGERVAARSRRSAPRAPPFRCVRFATCSHTTVQIQILFTHS